MREPGDVESLVEAAEERFGRVDVLYASAGVMLTGTAPETDEEVYRTVMDVNVGGTFRLVKYGIPALERAGGGSMCSPRRNSAWWARARPSCTARRRAP